jgi:hypothetical protein
MLVVGEFGWVTTWGNGYLELGHLPIELEGSRCGNKTPKAVRPKRSERATQSSQIGMILVSLITRNNSSIQRMKSKKNQAEAGGGRRKRGAVRLIFSVSSTRYARNASV